MKNYKISKNLSIVIIIILIEAIFLKIFMYDLLPDKYFYDAHHILFGMNGMAVMDKSYKYVADIFNEINVFGLTTIRQWGYLITVIFMPLLIVNLARGKKYSLKESLFIIASFTLLDIYVLGLSKDIIQFVYFFIVFLILSLKRLPSVGKLILSCAVLLYESLNFRVYYAIMAMMMVTIYFIYVKFVKNKNIHKKEMTKIVLMSILLFFIEVFIVQFINSNNYDSILNARYSVNIWRGNDTAANTIINDLLGKNKNYLMFIGNYIINFARLMFPIELLVKGPKQILFMIYQIYISINLFKSLRKTNEKNILWVITFLSFFIISVIFEPDFGSFVRHESAMILILVKVIEIANKGENLSEKNKNTINRNVS